MSAQHTPGPWMYGWLVDDEDPKTDHLPEGWHCDIWGKNREYIGKISTYFECTGDEPELDHPKTLEHDANVDLICAAPVMLEALQSVIHDLCTRPDITTETISKVFNAVAEATGQ